MKVESYVQVLRMFVFARWECWRSIKFGLDGLGHKRKRESKAIDPISASILPQAHREGFMKTIILHLQSAVENSLTVDDVAFCSASCSRWLLIHPPRLSIL